jgi:hypothetical protein
MSYWSAIGRIEDNVISLRDIDRVLASDTKQEIRNSGESGLLGANI